MTFNANKKIASTESRKKTLSVPRRVENISMRMGNETDVKQVRQ